MRTKVKYQPGYGSAMAPGRAPTAIDSGRVFGVPGFTAGQPGWAGQAGVAQIPRPGRGSNYGSRPPKTYGSLGYGSMGDGSMDMAVRTFASTPKPKRKKSKTAWGKI